MTALEPFDPGPTLEERLSGYIVANQAAIFDTMSFTKSRLADHCQVGVQTLSRALRLAQGHMAADGWLIMELERGNGYLLRRTRDVRAYAGSTLQALRTMATWMTRLAENIRLVDPVKAAEYDQIVRNMSSLITSMTDS